MGETLHARQGADPGGDSKAGEQDFVGVPSGRLGTFGLRGHCKAQTYWKHGARTDDLPRDTPSHGSSHSRLLWFHRRSRPRLRLAFLEDAGDQKFDFDNPEHRSLAAEWFAVLHGGAARYARAKDWLPSWGLEHWRKIVSRACETIRLSLANPASSNDDLQILQAVLSLWPVGPASLGPCGKNGQTMPETLVHGDFCPKNARVRKDSDSQISFRSIGTGQAGGSGGGSIAHRYRCVLAHRSPAM